MNEQVKKYYNTALALWASAIMVTIILPLFFGSAWGLLIAPVVGIIMAIVGLVNYINGNKINNDRQDFIKRTRRIEIGIIMLMLTTGSQKCGSSCAMAMAIVFLIGVSISIFLLAFTIVFTVVWRSIRKKLSQSQPR